MSAAPFGAHPTLAQYLTWAVEAGCDVKTGIAHDSEGRAHTITRVIAPGRKRWFVDVGTEQHEFLVPTTVSRFDRRLGLTSPFAALPHPDEGQPEGPMPVA